MNDLNIQLDIQVIKELGSSLALDPDLWFKSC